MHPEPVIYREEVTAALFALADMNVNIEIIRDLLEGDYGAEEEPPEDDA